MTASDISDVTSEAGVVASVIAHPEYTFYSEQLLPNHFTDNDNAYIYYAVRELAKKNVATIDSYSISNMLGSNAATKAFSETVRLTPEQISELIDLGRQQGRHSVDEYKILVDNVVRAAFRRKLYDRLEECQRLCIAPGTVDLEQAVQRKLDDTMMEFNAASEAPEYKDVVDKVWGEIKARQGNDLIGIPFKFDRLNQYATIERGELFLFGAGAKEGKSMMLLNCAVDLLRRGLAVLYLDSELNTRMFTCRLIAHLAGIEFSRIKSGRYSDEEAARIDQSIAWLKTRKFTHLYMPIFDEHTIYTVTKKVKHTQGLDVLIVDYLKDGSSKDALTIGPVYSNVYEKITYRIAGNP